MKTAIAAALFGACLFTASLSGAATFTPNVFDDPTPVAAPNGCVGQGSNPTRCSLREAALSSMANNEADTITLGEGTYVLSIPDADSPETGDLSFSEPDEDFEITLQGAGSDKTTIRAAASLNDRILFVFGDEVIATLSGFTVQDGKADFGGGMAINTEGTNSQYTLTDVSFVDNTATTDDGGGLWAGGISPTLIINGGTWSGNIAANDGGAMRLGGAPGVNTRFHELSNLVLTDNHALAGNGGAIFVTENEPLKLVNSQVFGNSAENPSSEAAKGSGGGIFVSNNNSPVFAEIINCVIKENTADGNPDVMDGSGGNGCGGMCGFGSGTLRVIDTTFADNEALNNSDGGGLLAFNGSSGGLDIQRSTFSGNSARSGAGFHHRAIGGTIREITNSTFSNNQATLKGGAIYIRRDDDGFTLNNVTIVGNSAADIGGGIASVGHPVTVRNSIFAENSSGDQGDDCSSFVLSGGFNIFASPANSNCPPVGDGLSPDDSTADPLLGPLADNGGPTLTYALLSGSPALGGGNPSGCLDGSGADLTVDQRGVGRLAGSACDIGAVETSITDLGIVKSASGDTFTVGDEITYTLTVSNNGDDSSPVLVSDTLPSAVTFVSAGAGCSESGGVVTCDLGLLAGGANVAVDIVVTAAVAGTAENTATVSGSDIDTNPDNNNSSVSIDVVGNNPDDGGDGGCELSDGGGNVGSPLAWGLFALALVGSGGLVRRKAST